MPNVTFKFTARQAVLSATIQDQKKPSNVAAITFQASGSKSVQLSNGVYDVGYRAAGTPNTAYDLQVTSGGTMNPVSRTLPANGKGAGVRTLTVP